LNSIIKGRKPGSITVREKIASHFELEYEDMLLLGRWILSGNDGNNWNSNENVPTKIDITQETNRFFSNKNNLEDKNLKLLMEWINQQNEPGDFWIFIKMELGRKYPEFHAWLKKRRGEDLQDQGSTEEKLAV
jgi:hypothetical protein